MLTEGGKTLSCYKKPKNQGRSDKKQMINSSTPALKYSTEASYLFSYVGVLFWLQNKTKLYIYQWHKQQIPMLEQYPYDCQLS